MGLSIGGRPLEKWEVAYLWKEHFPIPFFDQVLDTLSGK